jgi:pimeloyl-ACP methyl ester carboxylesterase
MPSVIVNGTELYYEIRGTGPPVLLIMGATGDGGHFDAFADVLADEFMVVTYDRRGNGRSPAPPGWQTTSPQEQADDAAGLLQALGTGPVAVFSTSSGGNFTLCLLVRHPGWVRGAILHEPGLYALVDDFDAVRAPVRALVQEAMEADGPPAAVERFWCYVAGEDGWNRLEPALRQRDLRAVPARRCGPGGHCRARAPARQRGQPAVLRRDRGPVRQAPGCGCRHHAGHARDLSRAPPRARGNRPPISS